MDIILGEKKEVVVDNQGELEIGGQEDGKIYPMYDIKVDK